MPATPHSAIRPDVRLENAPMQPVVCGTCGVAVLARKSSWDQTTVQWSSDALAKCAEHSAPLPGSERPNRNAFPGCSALRDSIREAAVRGSLAVQSDEPLKTNPEHQE